MRHLIGTLAAAILIAGAGARPTHGHDMPGHAMPGQKMQGQETQAHDRNGHDMSGHAMPAADKADSPSTKAFRDADAKMHRDMDIRYTNDVDTDFVRGMIPHHEGAIAMARIALQYSKDPEIRKLAEAIVAAQDVEIAQMQAFLKRRAAQ